MTCDCVFIVVLALFFIRKGPGTRRRLLEFGFIFQDGAGATRWLLIAAASVQIFAELGGSELDVCM